MAWVRRDLLAHARGRTTLALALAIALHVLVASRFPPPVIHTRPDIVVVHVQSSIRIIPRVLPTPTPTPNPTSAPLRIGHVEGRRAPKAVIRALAHPHIARTSSTAPPVLHVIAPPVQGAGSGAALAGSPSQGGTGNGNGTSGSGNGSGGNVPCGFVTFQNLPPEESLPDGSVDVRILMTVHFPDGKAVSARLDYPFHYASQAQNPFSLANSASQAPIVMQSPSPAVAASESPLVQYVLAHTTSQGFALLHPCPTP